MGAPVSVVVPLYNEGENAPILAERIDAVFAKLPAYEYECLFVNDGSRDGTRAAIERVHAVNPRVRPVHLMRNRGQSAAEKAQPAPWVFWVSMLMTRVLRASGLHPQPLHVFAPSE